MPENKQKHQATLRKLERYDAFISGLADVQARLSHYQRKYPDGWPCEVLFVVPTERRQRSTASALAGFLLGRGGTRLVGRALTLQAAAAHCAAFLPQPAQGVSRAPATAPRGESAPVFYGEAEHSAVNDFVLGMTEALAQANASLQRLSLDRVPLPHSRAAMLDFLKRARDEMARRRAGGGPSRG